MRHRTRLAVSLVAIILWAVASPQSQSSSPSGSSVAGQLKQIAYLKASNTGVSDRFGHSVAVLAVCTDNHGIRSRLHLRAQRLDAFKRRFNVRASTLQLAQVTFSAGSVVERARRTNPISNDLLER